MSISAVTIGVMIAGAALLVIAVDRSVKRRARRHMAARPKLSDEEFAAQYFGAEHAAIAATVRRLLREVAGYDLSQADPTDRLVEDLRIDAIDSLALVELVTDLEEEFDIKISDQDAERLENIEDIVVYVAAKRDAKSRHPTP